VWSHCSQDPSIAFAFFYFDFNDPKKQVVRSLICSLVTQFSRRCIGIPAGLATLYSNCLDGQHQPTTASITAILQGIITSFHHAYIVLDALDECIEQDDLLSFLEDVTDWGLDNLHILATSRPDHITRECLVSRITDAIDLQNALVDEDILTYVRERLQNDVRLRKWQPKVKDEIEMTLMEGAKGM
jgi:hypothetical protein